MKSPESRPSDQERMDVARVTMACRLIQEGQHEKAFHICEDVVSRVPENYKRGYEVDNVIFMKSWDDADAIHLSRWLEAKGSDVPIVNIGNAYPRAFFQMGYLMAGARQYDKALAYLDEAAKLEPESSHVAIERASVLQSLHRWDEAMGIYMSLQQIGFFVSPKDVARAKRGIGVILVEKGYLDEAESSLRESLEYEPDNSMALQELEYIAHLRQGATPVPPRHSKGAMQCSSCGAYFEGEEMTAGKDGQTLRCRSCYRRAALENN